MPFDRVQKHGRHTAVKREGSHEEGGATVTDFLLQPRDEGREEDLAAARSEGDDASGEATLAGEVKGDGVHGDDLQQQDAQT